jgi:hypothetical protein
MWWACDSHVMAMCLVHMLGVLLWLVASYSMCWCLMSGWGSTTEACRYIMQAGGVAGISCE